jgi:hypothetical protein
LGSAGAEEVSGLRTVIILLRKKDDNLLDEFPLRE